MGDRPVQFDDALAFITEYLRNPRRDGYSSYGYEFYMPNVIVAFIVEIEKSTEHRTHIHGGQRAVEISPVFFDAAWQLCRQGILRPNVRRMGEQSTTDGSGGNGYSLTSFGRKWLDEQDNTLLLVEPGRLGELLTKLSEKFGPGYLQRSNEAVRCYSSGAHLACCAMCGAAVESIILSVAIRKFGDESEVLNIYRAAQGRRKLIDRITGKLARPVSEVFRTATGLLSYWRDESAHGIASTISEIEAHEALARLIRISQFSNDKWDALTGPE